ncbi:MAG: lysoplasmalogenase [Microscillaceae bacterium]|jgi:uncharacterized membrane protein YhhN|nr:lysoplasmalogenase [Microscillaceae bacterium]
MEQTTTLTKKQAAERSFLVIFVIIALGDLVGRGLSSAILDYIFKPLIMLSLMIHFYQQTRPRFGTFQRLILWALFFSWLGDVLLMFEPPIFFQLGLSGFLISHLFYISAYIQSVKNQTTKPFLVRQPYWLLAYLAVLIACVAWMYPTLGSLLIPVVVYSVVLLSMSVFALNRKDSVNPASFGWVWVGSVFFIVSDMWLAINKFVYAGQLPWSGIIVMLTYILAQYCIVKGSILNK